MKYTKITKSLTTEVFSYNNGGEYAEQIARCKKQEWVRTHPGS